MVKGFYWGRKKFTTYRKQKKGIFSPTKCPIMFTIEEICFVLRIDM